MTATETNSLPDQQTPGQWAVRWFAVVFVAVLCASVPLVHIVWYGVLGKTEPVLATYSQKTPPDATVANVMSGEWMSEKERALQELSPVVWSLRGHWNELRFRMGVAHNDRVAIGSDNWMFLRNTLQPNVARFHGAKEQRLAAITRVRDAIRASGAELVVALVPDKARIYADRAYPDGVMPAAKADAYAGLLAEFASLEIACVDLATPMAAVRAATKVTRPSDELFYARDTHWRPAGALVAATAISAVVEARFGSLLSPRQKMRLTGPSSALGVGDLTSSFGFLSGLLPDDEREQRTVALSLLTDELSELRKHYGLEVVTNTGAVGMYGKDPDAEIVLVGTSFSQVNGMIAVSMALGRPVFGSIKNGPGSIGSMRATLQQLKAGKKPKLVIWEIVERGLLAEEWVDPPF